MTSHPIEQSKFDLVVLGTGLVESIVAAAVAKAGHSVLQIDGAAHYGGAWASFRLNELIRILQSCSDSQKLGIHVQELHYVSSKLSESQLYSLDISPRLLYGLGPMISLLLGSGAHNYTEYKLIHGGAIIIDPITKQRQCVPSSRAEIFRDPSLTLLQKRTLMRLINRMAEAVEGKVSTLTDKLMSDAPFHQILDEELAVGLDDHVRRCLLHGVLLCDETSSYTLRAKDALYRFKVYAQSVGRYGIDTGPFLTPVYGFGEVPQAFCRSAAVNGAVQILRCPVHALLFDPSPPSSSESVFTGIQVYKNVVDSTHITSFQSDDGDHEHVTSSAAALTTILGRRLLLTGTTSSTTSRKQLRCISILDGCLQNDGGNTMSTLFVLPEKGPQGQTVWGLQLCHGTSSCPSNQSVVHLWCTMSAPEDSPINASATLEDAFEYLLASYNYDNNDEKVLFCAYFSISDIRTNIPNTVVPSSLSSMSNVAQCSGCPTTHVTVDIDTVEEAKQCYWKLFKPHHESTSSSPFPLDDPFLAFSSSSPSPSPSERNKNDKNNDDRDELGVEEEKEEEESPIPQYPQVYDSDEETLRALQEALRDE